MWYPTDQQLPRTHDGAPASNKPEIYSLRSPSALLKRIYYKKHSDSCDFAGVFHRYVCSRFHNKSSVYETTTTNANLGGAKACGLIVYETTIMAYQTTPLDVLELIAQPSFAKSLPPMGPGARQLLAFNDADKEDPRLLALTAQNDPVYMGRLLSLANSAAYYRAGMLITSAETAVRRIGVRDTYVMLQACAIADCFPNQGLRSPSRFYLLSYTLSVCLTAKRLAAWLRLNLQQTGCLHMATLLRASGIYAGLLSSGDVGARWRRCLAGMGVGANLGDQADLKGFCEVSAQVARQWNAPDEIVTSLAVSDTSALDCDHIALLLSTTEALTHAKSIGAQQRPLIARLENAFPLTSAADFASDVDIGVRVT